MGTVLPPCVPMSPHLPHVHMCPPGPSCPTCPSTYATMSSCLPCVPNIPCVSLRVTTLSPNVCALWQEVPGLFVASWDIPLVALRSSGSQKIEGGKTLNIGEDPKSVENRMGQEHPSSTSFLGPCRWDRDTHSPS